MKPAAFHCPRGHVVQYIWGLPCVTGPEWTDGYSAISMTRLCASAIRCPHCNNVIAVADADIRYDWEPQNGYLLPYDIPSPQEALACPRKEIPAAKELQLALGHWWLHSAAAVAASSAWNAGADVVRSAERVHSLLTNREIRSELEGSFRMLELSMLEAESARTMGDFDTCRQVLLDATPFASNPWFRAIRRGLEEKSRHPQKIDWTQEPRPAPGIWQRIRRLVRWGR